MPCLLPVPVAPVPVQPFDALQDSQLFDAENSEPLVNSRGRQLSGQGLPRTRSPPEQGAAVPRRPSRRHSNGSAARGRRGTEASVLYGVSSLEGHKVLWKMEEYLVLF